MASRPSSAPQENNVKVVVRQRPSNAREDGQQHVVKCGPKTVTLETSVAGGRSKTVEKTYTFDLVFGAKDSTKTVYDAAIAPLVTDVTKGFNCTVFAYGQTGTGKTHTMLGDCASKPDGTLPEAAGVVPRAVAHIFEALLAARAANGSAEFEVTCTFLELYNEEITDLLTADEAPRGPYAPPPGGVPPRRKLDLQTDAAKGSCTVKGLEEIRVGSAEEAFELLRRGMRKRTTAETVLNHQSSRSHSVFTLSLVHRETSVEGEEIVRMGKLNLVDLAGSENVARSGATGERAAEAGDINKSLLTLGRVMNLLVEETRPGAARPFIPYRDSKLTRLLQDALGGRCKTCIIATVAPSSTCVDETHSTLDYASKAKKISNRPEVCAKVTKPTLVRDLQRDIGRLKEDLEAAYKKEGITLTAERHAEMQAALLALRHLQAQHALLQQRSAEAASAAERELAQLRADKEEREAQLGALRLSVTAFAQEQAQGATDAAAAVAAADAAARLAVSSVAERLARCGAEVSAQAAAAQGGAEKAAAAAAAEAERCAAEAEEAAKALAGSAGGNASELSAQLRSLKGCLERARACAAAAAARQHASLRAAAEAGAGLVADAQARLAACAAAAARAAGAAEAREAALRAALAAGSAEARCAVAERKAEMEAGLAQLLARFCEGAAEVAATAAERGALAAAQVAAEAAASASEVAALAESGAEQLRAAAAAAPAAAEAAAEAAEANAGVDSLATELGAAEEAVAGCTRGAAQAAADVRAACEGGAAAARASAQAASAAAEAQRDAALMSVHALRSCALGGCEGAAAAIEELGTGAEVHKGLEEAAARCAAFALQVAAVPEAPPPAPQSEPSAEEEEAEEETLGPVYAPPPVAAAPKPAAARMPRAPAVNAPASRGVSREATGRKPSVAASRAALVEVDGNQ